MPAPADAPLDSFDGTADGRILGTPAYMSPEQARGQSVDTRTDIWAFGCVLFEMLTGRRAFDGDTVTDTLAHVLEREPDWSALPREAPSVIRTLLQRCLRKDSLQRLRDIGDARVEIEEHALAGAQRRDRRFVAAAIAVLAGVPWCCSLDAVAGERSRRAGRAGSDSRDVGPGLADVSELLSQGRLHRLCLESDGQLRHLDEACRRRQRGARH
jgi:hypothetical protein